jgi:hypothetical protein
VISMTDSGRLGMAAACADAHDSLVGYLSVPAPSVYRPRLVPTQVTFVQEKSVHVERAQSQLLLANQGQQQGINGSKAKAIGTATLPVTTGVDASGVPPRGRPV